MVRVWGSRLQGFTVLGTHLAFFCLALRTLTVWGFYVNHNKEAKSLTFRRA